MPQTDITVQYLGQNKKNAKFGYIKSAEPKYTVSIKCLRTSAI